MGIPLAQASDLLNHQSADRPTLHEHDPQLDLQALWRVTEAIQKHISPLVAIETLDRKPWAGQTLHQPDSLLCDITGATHLFGCEANLLKAAKDQLALLGLTAQMAIADSVGAAWALAHYGATDNQQLESLQLESLPVESLRISPQTVATLARLGVDHIDQLLRLPRAGLATRLGQPLVLRIAQLLGETDEPLAVYRAAAEDTQWLDLEYPTSDQKILANRIATLTDKVRTGLATRQRGALQMTCRLDFAVLPPQTFELGLFTPTLDREQLVRLMVGSLESRQLPDLVKRITLCVTLSGPMQTNQVSLFSDGSSHESSLNKPSLSHLINSLSGRLGREAVLGVSLCDDPLPENAYQLSPLTGRRNKTQRSYSRKSRSPNSTFGPCVNDAMRRPLTLLPNPLPLSIVSAPSSSVDSSPKSVPGRFRLGGKIHCVVRHWGPERIETGWWQSECVRRDYFRIETDDGQWWWIYRTLGKQTNNRRPLRHQWMLHGRFS